MIVDEWHESRDAWAMIRSLEGWAGDRKIRLFAAGCCRLAWDSIKTVRCRRAVETAERFADGSATLEWNAEAFQMAQQSASSSELIGGMGRFGTRLRPPDAARGRGGEAARSPPSSTGSPGSGSISSSQTRPPACSAASSARTPSARPPRIWAGCPRRPSSSPGPSTRTGTSITSPSWETRWRRPDAGWRRSSATAAMAGRMRGAAGSWTSSSGRNKGGSGGRHVLLIEGHPEPPGHDSADEGEQQAKERVPDPLEHLRARLVELGHPVGLGPDLPGRRR